jgi:hypothetical protein
LLSIRDLDQRDFVLRAQRDDQLLVCLFFAGFIKDTHMRLASIERFGSFAETTCETIMHESEL